MDAVPLDPLTDLLGWRPSSVVALAAYEERQTYEVDGRFIVKVDMNAARLATEVEGMRAAASVGIPVAPIDRYEAGPPAVLVTAKLDGVALSPEFPGALAEAGGLLRRFHGLGAAPPYPNGEGTWPGFVMRWAEDDVEWCRAHVGLTGSEVAQLRAVFEEAEPLLEGLGGERVHGDFQRVHVLVDPRTQRVVAFLDFADVQPGHWAIDLAVLALWDESFVDPFLGGYGAAHGERDRARALLPTYRLLRHVGAAHWLADHGLPDFVDRQVAEVRRLLNP